MGNLDLAVEWKSGVPTLRTPRLILRLTELQDVDSEVAFYQENGEHLGPWFPDRPSVVGNRENLKQFVAEFKRRAVHDQGYRFQLCLRTDPNVYAGVVNVSRIYRGPEQTAALGYAIAKRLEGQGYMSEAVRAVVAFSFQDLDLHRLEALYAPDNVRSGALLQACGFEIEGTLRKRLRINGEWRDHVISAKVNHNWRGVGRTEQTR